MVLKLPKNTSKGIITPVIALTAFDKEEITEEALSAGINDIIKPLNQSYYLRL
jgi:CheY-like chemotaxis protein